MTKPPEIFARIYARHGHRCPMSTLGGCLGLAALRALPANGGPLRAVFGHRTCALDGIAEVTGCSEETGTLVVEIDGRHALRLASAEASVEVEISAEAMAIAGRYRALCNRLEAGWEKLDEGEQTRRRAEMDALLDELLPQFWQADETLLVRKVTE